MAYDGLDGPEAERGGSAERWRVALELRPVLQDPVRISKDEVLEVGVGAPAALHGGEYKSLGVESLIRSSKHLIHCSTSSSWRCAVAPERVQSASIRAAGGGVVLLSTKEEERGEESC